MIEVVLYSSPAEVRMVKSFRTEGLISYQIHSTRCNMVVLTVPRTEVHKAILLMAHSTLEMCALYMSRREIKLNCRYGGL